MWVWRDGVMQNEKTFVCTYEGCDKAFTRRGDLTHHMQRVHQNERPFKCTVEGCTKVGLRSIPHVQSFVSQSELKRHMETHTDTLPTIAELELLGVYLNKTRNSMLRKKRSNVFTSGVFLSRSSEMDSASRITWKRSQFPTNWMWRLLRMMNSSGYSARPP